MSLSDDDRATANAGRRRDRRSAGPPIAKQYPYYYHPDVLFDRTRKPEKDSAVDFLFGRLKEQPTKVTILATGPLTNVARLLTDKPESNRLIRRIFFAEANVRADPKAARVVLGSGVPLVVVPLDATAGLKLGEADVRRVFSPGTALSRQVQSLYQMWDGTEPPLADVLSAALCFEERFCTMKDLRLEIDDKGITRVVDGKSNARVATATRGAAFVKWYVDRMASCVPPAKTPAKPVAQGGMPLRVHVAEDFDNDIERRWWMSGKPETKILPPGSRRACRGVLTHDFDDLLGNPKAMETAVIFNPVPGPRMGKNTRLSFRYRLAGHGRLRVQIYSLSNGYHRHLILDDLPQRRWESATMDLTAARRPDGTGGPLSEGERIDDIQFYADPDAELIIDDIVLYEAAPAGEKRPFPKRILFTGGFDSGKQGKEWPGTFVIVPNKGASGHAAGSVIDADTGLPWIRLHLRGERLLDEKAHLSFRSRLSGADSMRVRIVRSSTKEVHGVELKNLAKDRWGETTIDLSADTKREGGPAPRPRKFDRIDEIHFLLPKGAELLLDDVLLYTPGG